MRHKIEVELLAVRWRGEAEELLAVNDDMQILEGIVMHSRLLSAIRCPQRFCAACATKFPKQLGEWAVWPPRIAKELRIEVVEAARCEQ